MFFTGRSGNACSCAPSDLLTSASNEWEDNVEPILFSASLVGLRVEFKTVFLRMEVKAEQFDGLKKPAGRIWLGEFHIQGFLRLGDR